MWSTSSTIRQLRPRHWIVPRSAMCATFWCGVICIMSSIVLLVTSKHKGRLYQSWGSVMLGCGCCLMLICIILCIHAFFVMNAFARNRQLGLTEQKFELVSVPDARHQPISKHDEARRLLMDSPSTGPINDCRQSSMSASSSRGRRARLSRMVAVDVDDSESQTSSCPTSSSSTSTTPPGHLSPMVHRQVTRLEYTRMPSVVTAAANETSSRYPVRMVTAKCRVTPLTNLDWRGDGQHQAGTSPGPAGLSASVKLDPSARSAPVTSESGHKTANTVTPVASRHCSRSPITTLDRSYNDDFVTPVDILMSNHVVTESKNTVYDNVQLHVRV